MTDDQSTASDGQVSHTAEQTEVALSGYGRASCPVCREERALTKAGVMRWHLGDRYVASVRQVCDGVGKRPAAKCSCPTADAPSAGGVRGYDPSCPVHGAGGTEPARRSGRPHVAGEAP